jgi:glyoxylase-like metal-dependent hydrolase (beta-lactamase superfamily II)
MKWGDFEIHLISDGRVWLDGGAMFGVVPRKLWRRQTTPDSSNRIPLGLNCLLVQTGSQNILIDTGCGHKYTQKEVDIYRIEHPTDILQELRKVDVDPDDVDVVINTHLHFDHCGGNTYLRGEEVLPTFPNATYVVRREEYEDACNPNERTKATYLAHNWQPVEARGQLQIVDKDCEIFPGIELVCTPGHTPGHQSIKIRSQERVLFYIADLCPTSAHIPLPWIMAYDLHPMTTLKTRKKIYPAAAAEEWLLFFEHDPEMPSGYLQEREGKYILQPQTWQ